MKRDLDGKLQTLNNYSSLFYTNMSAIQYLLYNCLPQVISQMMNETSSGSFCSNDSVLQSLMVTLPFGGVGKYSSLLIFVWKVCHWRLQFLFKLWTGASGTGSHHGRFSFETFSHKKSCLHRSQRFECVTYLRYPPYEERNLSLMAWASTLSQRSQGWCQILLI